MTAEKSGTSLDTQIEERLLREKRGRSRSVSASLWCSLIQADERLLTSVGR